MTSHEQLREIVARELAAIPGISREGLIERWESAHGQPPPKGISHRLLEYNAAYAIQIKHCGGLSRSLIKELEKGEEDKTLGEGRRGKPATKTQLKPGARLVREWHGESHIVDVVEKGFYYRNACYGSLSHVARKITGTRWSGPRFFGL